MGVPRFCRYRVSCQSYWDSYESHYRARLVSVGPGRPQLALVGPIWSRFVLFGPSWPSLTLFDTLWPCLPLFGLVWPCLNKYDTQTWVAKHVLEDGHVRKGDIFLGGGERGSVAQLSSAIHYLSYSSATVYKLPSSSSSSSMTSSMM